jgi:dipeptide/tripeptide permease
LAEPKPGFIAQVRSYPPTFWVSNTMEIFERMAWYGFYTVSSVYITGAVETGGLGFSSEQRGQIQAIVPFFLYLMPVLTGALADRYGYKRSFSVAFAVMVLAYWLLGQFHSFAGFLAAFMFVAVGAAIFKPVVVGTIARVTDESNSAMAFGIFYMMVNIGGFVGPIVAGIVRGWSWDYVFIACSLWALMNLGIVLLFYREPTTEAGSGRGRTLRKVLDDTVEVLGNLRFFITVFVVLIALMVANQGFAWFSWTRCLVFVPVWVVANLAYDLVLPAGSGKPARLGGSTRSPLVKRMYCSNWRFALFLLIMSGFWTSFNQIFITMPEYIRDFTETRPLIDAAEGLFGAADPETGAGVAGAMATINASERSEITHKLETLAEAQAAGTIAEPLLEEGSRALLESKVRLAPDELGQLVRESADDLEGLTSRTILAGRQVNPEFIINVDAGAIILFQVLVSFLMARFHRFTTMITGMVVAAVGIALSALAGDAGMTGPGGSIWIVIAGILIFGVGEMMASPTSQEYVGRIAPKDKVALYMGYYFVAVALGNLFGGILSGQLYGKLARDMQRPDLMWLVFGALMLGTAIVFLLYDRFALKRGPGSSMPTAGGSG